MRSSGGIAIWLSERGGIVKETVGLVFVDARVVVDRIAHWMFHAGEHAGEHTGVLIVYVLLEIAEFGSSVIELRPCSVRT